MPCGKKATINWIDKAQFIAHYAVDSCSTTLKVYVETGMAADTNLVLGIINTSPEDFVRFLLRPKGARTDRHGIRKLKTNEAAEDEELLADTAKLAADSVQLVGGWESPTYSVLGTALWEISQPIIHSLYYLLIANVTEDFAFDWYSGILLNPASKCNIGRFAFEGSWPSSFGFAFTNFRPSIPLFTPKGALNGLGGIDIFTGTWAVIITVGIQQEIGGHSSATAHFKLMLGAIDKKACGDAVAVDLATGQFYNEKKIVRKVSADDVLSVDVSLHVEGDPHHGVEGFILVQGFRI